ncbi:MAG: leukotoxin LktA family filamentous adhesin, partial [Rhodocyclaceae bacterium]|nr:leukotoxin LktA family filamentous adhesin [Rhodocyclaceae bacterium]
MVGTSGKVHRVTTGTMAGGNAFNSFYSFSVGAGDTVNLLSPSSAINLINIVRDLPVEIDGIVNAIKNGRVGGNVWFVDPHGMLVGKTGVVNVGSLNVVTPTQRFVDEFFLAPGVPDDASVAQLLGGRAPRNPGGRVSIEGRVNAEGTIRLDGGLINVGGVLYSGARFAGSAPDFTDVVNVNGLTAATSVIVREGRIEIVADTDVTVGGTVAAPGGRDVRGGDIVIAAGGDVDLAAGANIVARGLGSGSDGGAVNIRAGRAAITHSGALVDVSGGTTGDGGAIEFSASDRIDLAGGEFRAEAAKGKRGSVLVDPATVVVSSDFYAGGANYSILADDSITVNAGVTISTRNVGGGAGADQDTATSVGDSGNLTLSASSIAMQTGSRLLAHATPGFSGGDVTLTATRTGGEVDVLSGTASRIGLSGATIKGRNVSLSATSSHASTVSPVVTKAVSATIDVDSSRILAQGGALNLSASAATNSRTGAVPISAALQTVVSEATVDVRGSSNLATTTGDANLAATSTVSTEAQPTSALVRLAGDASVAISTVTSSAKVHLGDTAVANIGGSLGLAASNAVTTRSTADASLGGSTAAGAAVAVSAVNSSTAAYVDGSASITAGGALNLSAKSGNKAQVSAVSSAKGAQKDASGTSKGSQTLAKYKDTASTAEGAVDVAGAIAVSEMTDLTRAYVASTRAVSAGGAIVLSSKAANSSRSVADGSNTSGTVGVGAAVALNIGVSTNSAFIAD